MKSYAKFRFVVSIGLISLLLLGPQDAHANSLEKVVRAIKGVAWSALSVGVDEAGSRLLGATMWRIVKRVGEPALKELYSKEDKPRRTEVTRVVYSLDNDIRLRQNIRQRFEALPRDERDSLLRRIEKIEGHLFRIQRLTMDTNLEVKEIKRLLLSVLRTPTFTGLSPTAEPEGLRRFDAHDSLLTIFYPRSLLAPRKYQGEEAFRGWIAGGRFEHGWSWKLIQDIGEPFIMFNILGAPRKPGARTDKKWTQDAVRQGLTEQGCDIDDQRFLVQELSKEVGMLYVGMCDRTWPMPNTYVAVRLFYSNGANVFIRAVVVGDDNWEEYEGSLLSSMRLTKLRGPCGFYGTACCIPSGADACEPGLSCLNKRCLPRSSTKEGLGADK